MYTPFKIWLDYQYGPFAHLGTEPSSVIPSQTMLFKKLNNEYPKVSKQAEVKRDGVIQL